MLRVAIDARMIRYSGIGTYIRSLLDEYRKMPSAGEFSIFGDPSELKEYQAFNIRKLTVPIYSIGEQLLLPPRIGRAAIFHSPHYNAPLFCRGKLVVTIHDIIHLRFPEYLPSKKAHLYARYMLKAAARKAVRLITSSANARADLIERLDVPAEKIRVIPLGVDGRFRVIEDEDLLSGFRKKYGLPESFILYAGNLKAHKNLVTLLKAFKLLKMEKKIKETLLVTTGGSPVPGKLAKQVFDDGMQAWVRFLPFIPNDEMPLLYNCASVFVFPSLYEGFGLPPLEAFACGLPVVSSNAASLPEVLSEAAIMCNPGDVEAFADAIWRLLTDCSLRDKLKTEGRKRAGQFSWAETAKRTISVYGECG
jgi:glycosyltransferase involved in cell wall biosynthesis